MFFACCSLLYYPIQVLVGLSQLADKICHIFFEKAYGRYNKDKKGDHSPIMKKKA